MAHAASETRAVEQERRGPVGSRSRLHRVESELERPEVQRLVALASGVFAAAVVFLLTIHGPGLTQDGSTYEAAALSLRSFDGAVASDGTPMVVYPPGYSVVLMVLSLVGLSIRTAARVVGAASLGVLVGVMVAFLLPRVRHRVASLLVAGMGAGTAGSLLMFATWQLSDVLFATMTLVVVVILGLRHVNVPPWLNVLAMVLAAFAPLVRYIGVAVPVVAALSLIDSGRGRWWARFLRAGGVGALLITPTALWLFRNYQISGTISGTIASGGGHAPVDVLKAIGGTVIHWVVPSKVALTPPLPAVVGLALHVLVIGFLVASYRRNWVHKELRPLLLFIVVYLALLWQAELSKPIESVSARYLLPVFVVVLVLAVLAVDRAVSKLAPRGGVRRTTALFGLVLLGFVPTALDTGRMAISALRDGPGFFVPASTWTQSPVIKDLQRRSPGAPVYSNENAQVYLFANRYAYQMPEFAYLPQDPQARRWALQLARDGALLVWLHASPPQWPAVEVDGQEVSLVPVATYPDGTILRFVAEPAN